MIWRIGCSGYHYPEWRGIFYPQKMTKALWFQYYCEHFKTIELNVTFYKFPRVEFLETWYDRCPAGFTFSVKAPRVITHFKKFKDAQRYLSDFYTTVRLGLKDKLGCVLFQFPATFVYDEERLERIVRLTDLSFVNVFEFRHESWWNENVFRSFSERNIIFCGMDHPALPADIVRTSAKVYHRMHGVPHLYFSKYSTERLEEIVQETIRQTDVNEVYIYFNNTADGAAIENARVFHGITELVH